MAVQSHGGVVRVFPSVSRRWPDASVQALPTQGAFLVDADRSGGRTRWVRVHSQAGVPLVLRHGIDGAIDVRGEHGRRLRYRETAAGRIEVPLGRGETAVAQVTVASARPPRCRADDPRVEHRELGGVRASRGAGPTGRSLALLAARHPGAFETAETEPGRDNPVAVGRWVPCAPVGLMTDVSPLSDLICPRPTGGQRTAGLYRPPPAVRRAAAGTRPTERPGERWSDRPVRGDPLEVHLVAGSVIRPRRGPGARSVPGSRPPAWRTGCPCVP
ncbi:glycoside hydrolase family 95-like protein [Streptomyces acidicola]|uniref:glycoside hydrolase family 95-like protein n=1 Tax=Streptomyces acidicola TaxID=2596892 RepID=UPI0038190CDD